MSNGRSQISGDRLLDQVRAVMRRDHSSLRTERAYRSLTACGNVRYPLETPYRDATTHVIFEPLDSIAGLAALVPKPRVNLIRFHGVFAPNSKQRAPITPAKRGKGNEGEATDETHEPPPAERRASMTRAPRSKRVFNIEIETCKAWSGALEIIPGIEDPGVIEEDPRPSGAPYRHPGIHFTLP